jgi:DNA-binding response OmpR family regulator
MPSLQMAPEQQKRVLVVDDDADVRQVLLSSLRHRSVIVDEAADGDEALDMLGQNKYAVILLDLLMPKLDGFAVLEAMQKQALQSRSVVLILTGADRGIVDRLDAPLVHGIVRKPFDVQELVALVVACVEIQG